MLGSSSSQPTVPLHELPPARLVIHRHCSLVVSILDSPAVDPRSNPGSGSALLMSEKSQAVYYISSCSKGKCSDVPIDLKSLINYFEQKFSPPTVQGETITESGRRVKEKISLLRGSKHDATLNRDKVIKYIMQLKLNCAPAMTSSQRNICDMVLGVH